MSDLLHLNTNYYVNPNGLAFDFRDNSEITLIKFLGYEVKQKPIEHLLRFWKTLSRKLAGSDCNIVIVTDRGNNRHYIANYFGIENVCNNVWELSKLLNDKIYLNSKTKRCIVFADCGGTIPAILSSTIVKYHSINVTTPYLTIVGSENEFDTNQYTLWYSRELCVEIYHDAQEFRDYYDTLQYYDRYTQEPDSLLNMHWASNVKGTDLYFRNRANQLPKRSNITITDHVLPAHIEGHNLTKYLWANKQYQGLLKQQLLIQKGYLDTVTKL